MGTGTTRSFAPAGTGGHPGNDGRSNRRWRLLEIAVILSLSALPACSREPASHIGAWNGQLYFKDFSNPLEARFLFHLDGRVEYEKGAYRGGTESRQGRCRFEYDQFPPRLHIEFTDGTTLNGLVTFFGKEKTIMHIGVVLEGPPSHRSETRSYFFLTKNEGSARAAQE